MFHLPKFYSYPLGGLLSMLGNLAVGLVVFSVFNLSLIAQESQAEPKKEEGARDPVAIEDPVALPSRPVIRARAVSPKEEDGASVDVAPPPPSMDGDDEEVVVAIPVTTPEAVKESKTEEEVVVPKNVEIVDPGKVAAKDSTVKKAIAAKAESKALPKPDLKKKSQPDRPDQLGSSILTRTEARTFTFTIPAPRGQILDRNGYPLAQTKVAWYASISFPMLGKDVADENILRYAGERIIYVNKLLETDWDLSGRVVLQHYHNRRWLPLPFSSSLTKEQADLLKKKSKDGLVLHPVYQRFYPNGELLSHVLGYLGERPPINTGPILKDEPLWRSGKGVDGLEKSFDDDLRGTPGRVNVLFEGDGTKIKEDMLAHPKQGYNIVTTIDLEMQRLAERLLAENVHRGAMVIMDCRSGDIMAMASFPQFNPNDFIPSISQEKYSALINDPNKPLFPRAFRGSYPPASTFKVTAALSFLESGAITTDDYFDCPRAWTIKKLTMHNWNKKDEGPMNVVTAITRSCNTWFYEVSIHAGADAMSSMAMRLGLGQKTGIPLNDSPGFVPSNRIWLDRYGHGLSYGDEAVMSIGQGQVETTPLQLARLMASVGNGVQVWKPRLVSQVQDLNSEIVRSIPIEAVNTLNVDYHSLSAVRKGMYNVVNAGNGTGKAGYHKVTVAAKTGTGQWKPALKQNVAWYAGFFPAKYPIYSFAVIYEGDPGESVSGGRKAGPIVGKFLKEYLNEDHLAEVKAESQELRDQFSGQEIDEYVERESGSIFRTMEGQPGGEIWGPPSDNQEPPPQHTRQKGGLLERLFGRGKRP